MYFSFYFQCTEYVYRIWGGIRYNQQEFGTEYWTLQVMHLFKQDCMSNETGLSY